MLDAITEEEKLAALNDCQGHVYMYVAQKERGMYQESLEELITKQIIRNVTPNQYLPSLRKSSTYLISAKISLTESHVVVDEQPTQYIYLIGEDETLQVLG